MDAKIKARIDALLSDYVAACGGPSSSWVEHASHADDSRVTVCEPVDQACRGRGEVERVAVHIMRELLMRCWRREDQEGKARVAVVAVKVGNGCVKVVASLKGVTGDDIVEAEIRNACRWKGRKFEAFDSLPYIS